MRKSLALVVLGLASLARAQTCPCPPSNGAGYETNTIPVSPSSLTVCTENGCGTLAVQVTHRLVTPASSVGTPFGTTHFLAIEANNNSGFPEPPAPVTLTIAGGAMFTVTLTQPRFLFEPANKSLVSPPPPGTGPGFLCSKLSTSPTLKMTVAEVDQFGTNNPMKLDRLAYACQTEDSTPPATTSWLACFSLDKKASKLIFPGVEAFVDAETFGNFDFPVGDLHTIDELCLPATKS